MGRSDLRLPAVAGHFYPASPKELAGEVEKYLDHSAAKEDVIACVLPHAGYIYSGAVAGAVVSRLGAKDTVFLIGPNHTGYGTPFSVMAEGAWRTPLGDVPVNDKLARCLIESAGIFSADEAGHLREHSLEVELPFLQKTLQSFSIVPLTIASDDPAQLREAGERIAALIRGQKAPERILIAASSDMSHYEPQEQAREKDMAAIREILELDAGGLLDIVRRRDITMCGYAPVAAALTAAKELGARKGELVKYQTSGEVTGDFSSVVGYAGIIVR